MTDQLKRKLDISLLMFYRAGIMVGAISMFLVAWRQRLRLLYR